MCLVVVGRAFIVQSAFSETVLTLADDANTYTNATAKANPEV